MKFVKEAQSAGHYDLIVCGAGPGGIGAAIAAGRLGKKVLLLEAAGCLGGYWTSGLMGISLDMPGKGGIPKEIIDELEGKKRAVWVDKASYTYDIESMKVLIEKMVLEAGVTVLLYTKVTDLIVEDQRMMAVLAEGMTTHAFTADYFVDGTGHGTIGYLAKCKFETGCEKTGLKQPASLEALTVGIPPALWQSDIHNGKIKRKLKQMLLDQGVDCSYPNPLLFSLTAEKIIHKFAINHQYHVDVKDDWSVTQGTLQARKEINRAVDQLKKRPGWETFTLVQTAEQIGLRDNRRIQGLARVTVEDALTGRQFEDGVSPVHFSIDVHQLAPDYENPPNIANHQFKPFHIPMGSLIAKDLKNLFITGRCISGDFLSHSAYRTTCTACALGEAVGIAACQELPAKDIRQVDGIAVHQELLKRGYIF